MTTVHTPARPTRKVLEHLGLAQVDFSGEQGLILDRLLRCSHGRENVNDISGVFRQLGIPAKWSTPRGQFELADSIIGDFVSLTNALEPDCRPIGAKAIAYTVTAWAFDERDVPPMAPREGLRTAEQDGGRKEAQKYARTWKQTAKQAQQRLLSKEEVDEKPVTQEGLKLLLRSLTEGDEARLACLVWESLEGRLATKRDKTLFKGYAKTVTYPN